MREQKLLEYSKIQARATTGSQTFLGRGVCNETLIETEFLKSTNCHFCLFVLFRFLYALMRLFECVFSCQFRSLGAWRAVARRGFKRERDGKVKRDDPTCKRLIEDGSKSFEVSPNLKCLPTGGAAGAACRAWGGPCGRRGSCRRRACCGRVAPGHATSSPRGWGERRRKGLAGARVPGC